jgi:threonine/homoserine/homoserine lactone efflux protein
MPSGAAMSLFVVAAFLLLITPGPAVTYIVARSLSQGRTAGLVSSLGIGLGGLLHVTAAALGLSAIISSSALAFSVLKYAGAAYLIWLGMQRLFGASTEATEAAPPASLFGESSGRAQLSMPSTQRRPCSSWLFFRSSLTPKDRWSPRYCSWG